MPPLTNRLRAYPIRQVVQPLGSIALLTRAHFVTGFYAKKQMYSCYFWISLNHVHLWLTMNLNFLSKGEDMKSLIIISALIVLLPANTANAYAKEGRSLVHAMKVYNDPRNDLSFSAGNYVGYVEGIVDSTIGTHYCAPGDVNFEALLDIVSNYINSHPELLKLSAYVIVIEALSEAFPCNQ